MNIVILVSNFGHNIVGGTAIATYKVAIHLAQRGHEVHIVTSQAKGMPKETKEAGFFIHRCKIIRKPFLRFMLYSIALFRVMKKCKPDIVHVKSIVLGIFALMTKWIFKKPYILWAQGSDIYYPPLLLRPFYRPVLSEASAVIAQTIDEKKIIQGICMRDVEVIANGIDLYKFGNLTKSECRNKLELGVEKIILFVGSLRKVKGVIYLVEAMKTIIQEDRNVRLILIGDGQERQDLEKLSDYLNLGDFITFRGQLRNDEVIEYMIASDIFILPSLSEGFPVVIPEAMASGLPIITTNARGLPEIIQNNINGFIVETKNAMQIAERALYLLRDDETRDRIAMTNKQDVNNYTWERIINRLEVIYNNILLL